MSRQTVFSVVALFCLVASLLCLWLLNNIIQIDVYDFGLVFNDAWAEPYWNFLHIITALMVASMLFVVISIRKPKPERSRLQELEKTQKPIEFATEATQKRKTYNHTIFFRSLLDAQNFEETLKKRCPVTETKLKLLDDRPILTFRMFEPIEDLEDFAEIVDFTIVEEEN